MKHSLEPNSERLDTTDDSVIMLSQDFERLKSEVEKLRTELSMLVLERDELLLVECKNIETAYMLSIGALEYKAYEIECAVLRMKRKAELIQAKKNRQEKVVLHLMWKNINALRAAEKEVLPT